MRSRPGGQFYGTPGVKGCRADRRSRRCVRAPLRQPCHLADTLERIDVPETSICSDGPRGSATGSTEGTIEGDQASRLGMGRDGCRRGAPRAAAPRGAPHGSRRPDQTGRSGVDGPRRSGPGPAARCRTRPDRRGLSASAKTGSDPHLSDTVDNLILDLLEWIGPSQRRAVSVITARRRPAGSGRTARGSGSGP